MTIPEHIREEAKSVHKIAYDLGGAIRCVISMMDHDPAAHHNQEVDDLLVAALLAAEQRGMERAAEIAEEEQQGQRMMKAQAGAQNDRKASRDHESMAMCAGFIAAAIRKAREERG